MFQIQSRHVDVGNPVGKNKIKKKVRAAVFPVLWSGPPGQFGAEMSFESRTTRSARGGGRIAIAWSGRRSRLLGFPWIGPCRGTSDVSLVLYTLVICDRSDGDEEPPRPR